MSKRIPVAHSSEILWLLREITLSSVTACVPHGIARRLYAWTRSLQLSTANANRHRARLDELATRMSALLGDLYSRSEIDQHLRNFLEMRLEDRWTRSRLCLGTRSGIQTEVHGLGNLHQALEPGNGVVLWGMSFCGTLFPKVALARAGVPLTHLSAFDHGAAFPLSWLGKNIITRMYSRAENRYLAERIRIPEDGNPRYINKMYETLNRNGCVWINAEVIGMSKPISVSFMNQKAELPPGAPRIALKQGATLLPVHTRRLGPFRYAADIGAPIALDRETDRKSALQAAAQTFADQLAARVRETPGEWEWDSAWVKQTLELRG